MSVRSHRYGAILVSALIFAPCARLELPWTVLMWVALVPWITALERESRPRAVIWSGVVMSMAYAVVVLPWFALAVTRYTGTSPLLTGGLLILAAPLLQPQFIVFAVVRHGLSARRCGNVVVSIGAASAWVGSEWLCPRLLGDTLGHGLYPFSTLRQAADLAGAPGLTLLVLLVNECVHAALASWRHSARRAWVAIATATILVGTVTGYGALRLRQVRGAPTRPPLTAALVQANLGDYEGLRKRLGTFGAVRNILDAHTALSADALKAPSVSLVVWPETVYPTTFGNPKSAAGAQFDAEIVEFAARARMPLFFGTYERTGEVEHNAAVLLQPREGMAPRQDVYLKRRLFPLTEEVPGWLESTALRSRLPWLGAWRAGDGPPILTLDRRDGTEIRLAPMICLDAVDPSLALDAARSGADLILTLSNDGWFAGGMGARLHLVVSAFRSIETRLPQLRATNTGITAIITPTGDVVDMVVAGRPAVLTGTVRPGRRGSTLTISWGDWLGPVACVLAILLAVRAVRVGPNDERPARHEVERGVVS